MSRHPFELFSFKLMLDSLMRKHAQIGFNMYPKMAFRVHIKKICTQNIVSGYIFFDDNGESFALVRMNTLELKKHHRCVCTKLNCFKTYSLEVRNLKFLLYFFGFLLAQPSSEKSGSAPFSFLLLFP